MPQNPSDATHVVDDVAISAHKKQSAAQKRKRTKTGCLTCRRRRIKCDENHPVCANCVRSRRPCEGYKTPLVFRSSDSASFASNHYNTNSIAEPSFHYYQHATHLEPLAYEGAMFNSLQGHAVSRSPPTHPTSHLHSAHIAHALPTSPRASMPGLYHPNLTSSPGDVVHAPVSDYFAGGSAHPDLYSNGVLISPHSQHESTYIAGHAETNYILTPVSAPPHMLDPPFHYQPPNVSHPGSVSMIPSMPPGYLPQPQLVDWAEDPLTGLTAPIPVTSSLSHIVEPSLGTTGSFESISNHHSHHSAHMSALVDLQPRLMYADSEHSTPHDEAELTSPQASYRYSPTMTAHIGPHPSAQLELDPYFSREDDALMDDPYTKGTFQHFVRVTGAMLTAFDRSSPFDHPVTDQNSTPFVYPGLWTYTLPMLGFKDRGLLHGMLALASLQVAQRTKGPTMPSWKHYTESLRRVHRAVRDPQRRRNASTFAATMLLAYYEVAAADHSKWSMHLSGAAQLIREMDFAGMSKQIRCMSRERSRIGGSHGHDVDYVLDQFSDFDIDLVSKLVGEPLYTNALGYVWRKSQRSESKRGFTNAELSEFSKLQDIYWWFIRHDVIHALVGGTDLLLEYQFWTECPPRAPMGSGLAHYGSFDHLLLITGRLIKWMQKDRKRKRRVFDKNTVASKSPKISRKESSGGGKRTPANLRNSPGSTSGVQGIRPDLPSNVPSYYGFTPSRGTPPMPQAFASSNAVPAPAGVEEEDPDLDEAMAEACEEWDSIRQAFDVFGAALGPDFEPLSENEYPSFDTPFGRALQYRSNGIACLVAWYYTTLIIALRVQPSMPPFAPMAVGAAAQYTADLANTVGRVIAGIRPDLSRPPLKSSDAGPISDCAVPLFFAAVQYQDADQRAWTIDWLKRADSMTSFASIALCANGCESAWVRAAELGRGPPYQRTMGIRVGEIESEATNERNGKTGGATRRRNNGHRREDSSPMESRPRHGTLMMFHRGQQSMKGYSVYSVVTEDMGRLSLVNG